jgi:hypothetical protein
MGKNKVITKVEIYEVDDKEVPIGMFRSLKVLSHWNRRELVVIEVNGKKYTVEGDDLMAAIENAQNVAF